MIKLPESAKKKKRKTGRPPTRYVNLLSLERDSTVQVTETNPVNKPGDIYTRSVLVTAGVTPLRKRNDRSASSQLPTFT